MKTMDNLQLWNSVRAVPSEALKPITGGRLKGMSDINPVWRLKTLTEQFGTCGFGWNYTIEREWLEQGASNEISAFVKINLFVKVGGEWSGPIPGIGGSSFVTNESRGLYTSDECYKMALTDAISVACKALGIGADVYFAKDQSKYGKQQPNEPELKQPQQPQQEPTKSETFKTAILITDKQRGRMFKLGPESIVREVCTKYGFNSTKAVTKVKYESICKEIETRAGEATKAS